MSLSTGQSLGPYTILAPLGAGGMGEIYRARDARLNRDVAIKVIPPSVAGNPEALARFERESHAIAALSHPNILTIFDVGHSDGHPFAVMELLEGETSARVSREDRCRSARRSRSPPKSPEGWRRPTTSRSLIVT